MNRSEMDTPFGNLIEGWKVIKDPTYDKTIEYSSREGDKIFYGQIDQATLVVNKYSGVIV